MEKAKDIVTKYDIRTVACDIRLINAVENHLKKEDDVRDENKRREACKALAVYVSGRMLTLLLLFTFRRLITVQMNEDLITIRLRD
jgi:hypothetical protein